MSPGEGLAFCALAEHAACGLLLTAADGTINLANATFCGWLGYTAPELIGKRRVQDLLTMGGRVFHQTHWAPLLQMQGSVSEVKLDLRHAQGHTVPMLLNALVRERAGVQHHELAFMVVTDRHKYERELILERRRAEEALAAHAAARKELQESRDELHHANMRLSIADRKKDEFLATLAHELRNPLAPMRTAVEIFRLKPLADPHARLSADIIQRQLRHMTHLVDDLMEASRITQGKFDLRLEPFDLAEAMRDAIEASAPFIESSAHQLNVIWPTGPLLLNADKTRITQVILNLLNNAAKYTPAGGNIQLSAQCEGEEAHLSVSDSGIGIPVENLGHVFEMFSQLPGGRDRAQGGLGIGLALVHGVVQMHGGSVSASSAGIGHGSEFIVRLPCAPAQDAQVSASEIKESTATSRRILVVDDNEDAAVSLSLLLEIRGHVVFTAHDGASALRLAGELMPDLALLDIGLPGLDGYEVARRIRQAPWGQEVMLVAITGWGQQRDKQLAIEAGFNHHLTKPIDPADLLCLLAS